MRLRVTDGRRRLRLIKSVASFVLLAHPVDNKHDDSNSKDEAGDSEADTSYNTQPHTLK